MERVIKVLKPKPNPKQKLRDCQTGSFVSGKNAASSNAKSEALALLTLQIRFQDIQNEEKRVQRAIREAAKRNDMGSAKALAKEIVMSRKATDRLRESIAQLNSVSIHLGESVVIARTVGHLSKSADVMKLVNNLMKAPEVAVTMKEFSKEMTKAGIIEETVNDAIDSALDAEEDIEEEIEVEVDKVLTEFAVETTTQLPQPARKEKLKPAAARVTRAQDEAIAEGADDEEELEEIRARLAREFGRNFEIFSKVPFACILISLA